MTSIFALTILMEFNENTSNLIYLIHIRDEQLFDFSLYKPKELCYIGQEQPLKPKIFFGIIMDVG